VVCDWTNASTIYPWYTVYRKKVSERVQKVDIVGMCLFVELV
jgi:hypothetical protein